MIPLSYVKRSSLYVISNKIKIMKGAVSTSLSGLSHGARAPTEEPINTCPTLVLSVSSLPLG